MNKNKKYLIILILLVSFKAYFQNDSKLTIYNLNPLNYNPAFAGSSDGLYAIGIYSSQWVGFEGAPKTQYFAVDTNLENPNIGLGLNLNNDQSGAAMTTNIESNFSYSVKLNAKIKTSFGAKVGYNASRIDLNILKRLSPEEEVFGYGRTENNSLTLGFGFTIYTNNFFIGISSPNILTKKYFDPSFNNIIATQRTYLYSLIGFKIINKREFQLTPTLLARATSGTKISTLASINFDWQNKFIGGLNFEPAASIGAFVGFNVFKGIKVGYAYDRALTSFSQYNIGSHTLFMNFYLENNNNEKCSCKLF